MNYPFIRRGGMVRRFHTHTTIRDNTVAEHSWGVAVVLMEIWPEFTPLCMRAVLLHDVLEAATGDIPYTIKRDYPHFNDALTDLEIDLAKRLSVDVTWDLSEEEWWFLKAADMLDLMQFCVQEYRRGNVDIREIYDNGDRFIASHIHSMPESIIGYRPKVLNLRNHLNGELSRGKF